MRRPRSGRTVVDTPGSPVQLLEESLRVVRLCVSPLASNDGLVAIGGPETREIEGQETGRPMLDELNKDEFIETDTDLSLWWVDAALAGEGVRWLAIIEDEE